jgi:hypothetical protein
MIINPHNIFKERIMKENNSNYLKNGIQEVINKSLLILKNLDDVNNSLKSIAFPQSSQRGIINSLLLNLSDVQHIPINSGNVSDFIHEVNSYLVKNYDRYLSILTLISVRDRAREPRVYKREGINWQRGKSVLKFESYNFGYIFTNYTQVYCGTTMEDLLEVIHIINEKYGFGYIQDEDLEL